MAEIPHYLQTLTATQTVLVTSTLTGLGLLTSVSTDISSSSGSPLPLLPTDLPVVPAFCYSLREAARHPICRSAWAHFRAASTRSSFPPSVLPSTPSVSVSGEIEDEATMESSPQDVVTVSFAPRRAPHRVVWMASAAVQNRAKSQKPLSTSSPTSSARVSRLSRPPAPAHTSTHIVTWTITRRSSSVIHTTRSLALPSYHERWDLPIPPPLSHHSADNYLETTTITTTSVVWVLPPTPSPNRPKMVPPIGNDKSPDVFPRPKCPKHYAPCGFVNCCLVNKRSAEDIVVADTLGSTADHKQEVRDPKSNSNDESEKRTWLLDELPPLPTFTFRFAA
ncbi:hypothetical protein K402DRAFT_85791 [Aulographum hederae CBS 113979]|uniref:Uncharacterized protein n=1 Tax=Aulographum hederae CBS 113979 TaxID=1176131 RepID=A0A6G1GZP4_9PEZI|nr:hypothetical protein K402DRAFT_85791 [Aulographum hederae CBS 113979]